MKKFYLRQYSPSKYSTDDTQTKMLNIAVEKAVESLKRQGLNIELLEYGNTRLIEFDENTVPMYRSKVYRKYYSIKLKINRFIWDIKNKYF